MILSKSIIAVLLCMLISASAFAGKIKHESNIDLVRDIYNKVNQTVPSIVNAEGNTKLIRARLKCYAEHPSYSQRTQICNDAYLKKIVYLAREAIHSNPDIGRFIPNVSMCPIMFNLCMGKTDKNSTRCIIFERQCIDYNLDVFWRGESQRPKTPSWPNK